MSASKGLAKTLLSKWQWMTDVKQVPVEVVSKWWEVVYARYTEPQRYYHTLTHIDHMLGMIEDHSDHVKDLSALCIATVFHDIIYEPKSGDNEEKSAELFEDFAKEAQLTADTTKRIVDWILLTKSHTTPEHTDPQRVGTEDVHYLLDADMAKLGDTWQDFRDTSVLIRKEYIHHPVEAYRTGRRKVLKSFLVVPHIFSTKEFRDKYETQARDNIQKEIDILESGTIISD